MIRSIVLIIVFLTCVYVFVFGRAFAQNENHLGILMTLPKVIVKGTAERVDDEKYLASSREDFIKEMEIQGYVFVEQMGAGYVFEKDGVRYMSTSRMYSSHFMTFTYPHAY